MPTVDSATLYAATLSPLHYEIEHFAQGVVPTAEEKICLQDVVTVVDECVANLLGRKARVEVFGSFAMGLSTHASDLDLVILNVLRVRTSGLRVEQRATAIKILYRLAKAIINSKTLRLSHMQVKGVWVETQVATDMTLQVVARARVPVLKIRTKESKCIDLLLHNPSGVEAARHMREMLKQYPATVPVILVLKCLLRDAGLTEVSLGGLGGYALANMVLAYCMGLRKAGRPDLDYGEVLLGFLELFGHTFDFKYQAVSSRRGEVLKKSILEKETLEWVRYTDGWQGRTNGKEKLLIEHPLSGINVAAGTTRFPEVQHTFRQAFAALDSEIGNEEDVLPKVLDVDGCLIRNGVAPPNAQLMTVKKALKKEGYDRYKAREDIRAYKKTAWIREKQRRKSKRETKAFSQTVHFSSAQRQMSCRLW